MSKFVFKKKEGPAYVIGIDEAGRGPLAGPIVVGLVMMKASVYEKYKKEVRSLPKGLDSKKLSASRREHFFDQIKEMGQAGELSFKVIMESSERIDRLGLSAILKQSIKKGLKDLGASKSNCLILLDGGLKAPKEFRQETLVKGDERERIIGLASISAKVLRDRKMQGFSKKFPQYGFHSHKGYGTAFHREKIKVFGLSAIHRKSFCKKFLNI